MQGQHPIDSFAFRLRATCSCGSDYGHLRETNGQACVFCVECSKWQYNSPKYERGLAPKPVRSSPVSPSRRYEVALRAGFICELCGKRANETEMHVGHLLSEVDIRAARLELSLSDDFANLAWLCAECNLGMGRRSLPLHELLVFLLRRQIEGEVAS